MDIAIVKVGPGVQFHCGKYQTPDRLHRIHYAARVLEAAGKGEYFAERSEDLASDMNWVDKPKK
ncbi:MAG: hypothetical protein ACI8Y7_000198 [Candidatus Woesearchaeota archaeon]